MSTKTAFAGPLTQAIERNLRQGLNPTVLRVVNESWKHAGHAAVENDTTNETHFHVTVVSDAFSGKKNVQRHRMIYSLLKEELDNGLHALQLKTLAPEEFKEETVEE